MEIVMIGNERDGMLSLKGIMISRCAFCCVIALVDGLAQSADAADPKQIYEHPPTLCTTSTLAPHNADTKLRLAIFRRTRKAVIPAALPHTDQAHRPRYGPAAWYRGDGQSPVGLRATGGRWSHKREMQSRPAGHITVHYCRCRRNAAAAFRPSTGHACSVSTFRPCAACC